MSGFETQYGLPGGHGHHEEEGEHDEHGDEHDDDDEHDDEHDEHGDEDVRIDMERIRYDIRGAITKSFGVFQGAKFRLGYVDYEHVEGGGGLPVVVYSQADADFRGGEVDLSIVLSEQLHSSWHLDLFGDLVRAEFDDGGYLPRIPASRYGAGIKYRSDRLRAGIRAWRVSEQDRVAENETPTEAYSMVNANVSYRFFFSKSYLDVILRGSNLTDEDARLHTSFSKDEVPLPGRNINLIMRLGF